MLKEIVRQLPSYDYLYLGDNARAPYGPRSFDTVYQYTLECVQWLFSQGCPLVILACNTASAKALRTIQQKNLPHMPDPSKRVLGVIRPTAEVIGQYSTSRAVGVLATRGTVLSESYVLEIARFFPDITVTQEACPMWVPLVENNEHTSHGADYFVKHHISRLLDKDPRIDCFLLGCTHYPLLMDKIREHTPVDIKIVSQGDIVAESLADYLQRHPEMERRLSRLSQRRFYTTDLPADFEEKAGIFYGEEVKALHLDLHALSAPAPAEAR